jgi:hypothetical protein
MAPARTPCQRSHSTDLTRGLLDAGWYAKGVTLFLEGLRRELTRCEALATHEPFPVRQALIEAADLTPETKADFQWLGRSWATGRSPMTLHLKPCGTNTGSHLLLPLSPGWHALGST